MIKIGVAQIANTVDIHRNFLQVKSALSSFENTDVELIVFPECSLSGFSSNIKYISSLEIEKYILEIQDWSFIHNKYVILPTAVNNDAKIYNSGFLIGFEEPLQFYKEALTKSENFFSLHL